MKFRIFILITSYIFICFNLSGSSPVDSLKILLNEKHGVEKFSVLEQLAEHYINSNLDSNFYYLNQLKNEAVKSQNRKYEAIANTSIGLNCFFNGKYFDAEEYLQQAIILQKQIKDTTELAHSYNVLAGVYGESGQYSKSIIILFDAIDIFESQNNLKGMVTAFNNLGFLYMKLEDYRKAMEYYKKAIPVIDKNQLDNNKGFLYSNIGICYKEFNQYDSALVYYQKALEQYKANETINAIPILYQSLGNLYGFRLNKPDSALFYFEEGIKLAKQYDPNSLIELYHSLGQLYSNQKEYKKSVNAFNESLTFANNSEDLSGQMQAYFELFQVEKEINQLAKAIEHFENYMILKDSIDAKETKTNIARLVEKYENDKNKILIQQLNIKQKADERLMIAMFAGITLLIILLTFIVFALFQRKKRNKLEKELLNAEKQTVEEELQFKNKQMASQALMMMQKNKMLQGLHESIQDAKKEPLEKMPQFLNIFKNQINHNLQSEKDWELFKLYFEQVNKTFFRNLETINPELTQNDLRLAALIKLRFNIKEAASVLNLAPNSIKGARSRLRIKLHLENSEDLALFIAGIE
ncbi:MAG: tetratricopeptide repeat protein [Prolixibacteraceae bacterium]|nr:tetratricopeptide repeat protein [Prolixibacteraceae bacterium]MBT6764056.1 tetratricopeptide repeat protein [Prolixibacteraceae bacterium]MBT6998068.1 tetratricopeptide repeat protein [Prolixibacteraceae bacterium]MBT7395211.1 tetratricopeptide repeat protein [Prolixibacteraceae bacterium]